MIDKKYERYAIIPDMYDAWFEVQHEPCGKSLSIEADFVIGTHWGGSQISLVIEAIEEHERECEQLPNG